MSNIVRYDFRARRSQEVFSADVYSFDMKKYRFQVEATSITEAHYTCLAEALHQGIQAIRCIAIYLGMSDQRAERQVPAKVWQQLDRVAGGLVEY